jgi:hypothetical protein
MQRREKQKKAARDLVRARTLARGVTRNGTENGESGLAAVLVRREGAQLKNLSRLSHLSCATTPCDGHVRPTENADRLDATARSDAINPVSVALVAPVARQRGATGSCDSSMGSVIISWALALAFLAKGVEFFGDSSDLGLQFVVGIGERKGVETA